MGIAGLLASIFSICLVDVAGRKLLLIVSGIGTCLATALLGTHFFITRPSLCDNGTNLTATLPPSAENATTTAVLPCNPQYAPVAIASVLLYFVLFNFGWGPVPWVLLGEMLPMQVRGVASGIVIFVNWGTSAIVTGFYPAYNRAVMPWFAWWSFAVMNFASVVFVTFALFETKGKTLEEIQKRFERKKKWYCPCWHSKRMWWCLVVCSTLFNTIIMQARECRATDGCNHYILARECSVAVFGCNNLF